jgi:Fanconi anemia group M protein
MVIKVVPREYQKKIFETAIEYNTLVVLPTGIGKTLIALLLTVERMQKYPASKILFLAPTKPLVEQHFQSFTKELPELFADLQVFTGAVSASERKKIWNTAEIIFSTPQCIANDIEKGLYNLNDVSLLIIDEAHRCLKNYDYTTVVAYYKRTSDKQRILGLTASPGSSADNVRQICQHLAIEKIEMRTRDSPDVKPYLQERENQKIEVPFPKEFVEIQVLLRRIFDSFVNQLKSRKLLFGPVNKISLLKLQNNLARQVTSTRNGNAMVGMSLTAQAIKISHAQELLETQTLSGLNEYLKGLIKQAAEKKSKGVQNLVKLPEFNATIISLNELLTKKIEHPKINEIAAIIEKDIVENPAAKTIIFTQFRETASQLQKRLSEINGIRPAIFIGQAKKANSGLSQKEQKEILDKFRLGELNVLCATSIGEEGLDIPEVSAVIFYEPIPSAIRKIQRAGRTARLAPGKIIILITKDTRDEINHYAAGAREKKMYKVMESVQKEIEQKSFSLSDFTKKI